MARVGLLGLEPFVVSQVEKLDRNLDVVVLDAVDDDARGGLDLDVVVVNPEHAGAPRFLSSHPRPPVVVVQEGVSASDEPSTSGEPIRLGRPISSPELLEAIDRSRGVSWLRRSLRAIAIEQDDAAVPDRWGAVVRTLTSLSVLAWGASQGPAWPLSALVVITVWSIGRALWWRLTPGLVAVDATVVLGLVLGVAAPTGTPPVALTLLATVIALEAGFAVGLWKAVTGAVLGLATIGVTWVLVLGYSVDRVIEEGTASLLVVTAVGTGAMARRLWQSQTQTRSSELRRFRSALYELSRRQAIVAVSFDVGTVAEDALARLIADVRPQAAVVLVADGAGPLQVGASHNLATPPPVRLTWQPGLAEDQRAASTERVERATTTRTTAPSGGAPDGPLPDWRSSRERDEDASAGARGSGEARESGEARHRADPPTATGPGDDGPATHRVLPVDDPSGRPDAADDDGLTGTLLRRMQAAGRAGTSGRGGAGREQDRTRFDGGGDDGPGDGGGDDGPGDGGGEEAPVAGADHQQRARGRRRAGPHEQHVLDDLLDRTTIEAVQRARLTEILGQLATSLPATGDIHVHGAELDGELMGALVVVGPTDTRPITQHAEEAALALDSVRLFNRLRAFTRDQERARIGRSLHDGVMQTLAHVALELDRVSNESWDESQAETLGQLRDHVLGTVDEMRAVVNDLRTVRLDRGLAAALEAMALTLSPAGGPVIEVTTSDVGTLPGDVEEQFLRIAEEALTNAVRHSGGRTVQVDLRRHEGSLVLQVIDDGFGFTQSRVGEQDGGVGLTSMYQRAKAVGAGLDIDTGANGTIITTHLPLGRPSLSAPTAVLEAPPPPPRGRFRRG